MMYGIWQIFLMESNQQAINESTRLNVILKGMSNDSKKGLQTKALHKKDGVDYNETFSPVYKKDSFRMVMALVAHYDLELHQMDVKTAFLNGDLDETIFMAQTEGFVV